MAPHDRVIWLTDVDMLGQIDRLVKPILSEMNGKDQITGLSVIIRLSEWQRASVRFMYGVLFSAYQKCTLAASRIDPSLTAKLDLCVYLEHLADLTAVTSGHKITFVLYDTDHRPRNLDTANLTFEQVPKAENYSFVPESPLLITIPENANFQSVALGGTFDHLHSGHKLMLSLAALVSQDRVLCGVTAEEMLTSKTHPQRLEPLDRRMLTVERFLREFKKSTCLEIVTLRDPFGPTVELEELEALVVSPETLSGGLKINEIRAQRHLGLLDIIQVDLIVADERDPDVKLSSTFIRSHIK